MGKENLGICLAPLSAVQARGIVDPLAAPEDATDLVLARPTCTTFMIEVICALSITYASLWIEYPGLRVIVRLLAADNRTSFPEQETVERLPRLYSAD